MINELKRDAVKLTLPCKPEYVMVARMAISAIANKMEFDIEEIDDIKVAVGEACNNAIIHGCSEKDTYDIEAVLYDDYLEISVSDHGDGFDVEECEEPDLANPKVGGLGIFIIKTLMDDVDVKSIEGKGTIVTMKKKIAVL